ncbi:MAG: hypothetical protein GC171_15195 [Terrimonas sp.]|nr:hypothetical protein [Terrimonas sp.]
MKKILLAIDALQPDLSALDFSCFIAGLSHSGITGVFLENLVADERPVLKEMSGQHFLEWELDKTSDAYQLKQNRVEEHIAIMRETSFKKGIDFNLHRDKGLPAHEMIEESRFADMIIVDAATSFRKRYEGVPSAFVKDILKEAECPVIVAPESFEGIDEIVFTYNGTPSSIFAIKQFTYLFPELKDKRTIVFRVHPIGEQTESDHYKFKEWIKKHYTNFNFYTTEGDVPGNLLQYLYTRKHAFVVMGGYGRSELSRFFKKSKAGLLIKTLTLPFFITHR